MVRTEDTSDQTFESLMEFGKALKKVTVACKVRGLVIASEIGYCVYTYA